MAIALLFLLQELLYCHSMLVLDFQHVLFLCEKIEKNIAKKMPKSLLVKKKVLPLHSLNETHGASVKKNAKIAQLVEHDLAQKKKGSNLGKASKAR